MPRTRDVLDGTDITAVELRTVKLAAVGASHREIGEIFGIEESAVTARFYRMSKRFGTRSTTHTVVECIRRGWLDPAELGGVVR